MMAPHQERVTNEFSELRAKIEALTRFVSGAMDGVHPDEVTRLRYQLYYMRKYRDILMERIKAF